MHLCMIDWKLMRAFIAVIEEGTLSGAAERVGATQPTLGRQIRNLELVAGDVLFVRRGLRLEPTENALALLSQAQHIESEISSLGRMVENLGQERPRTKITLTAPTLLCDEMLPDLFLKLKTLFPGISFDIIPSDTLEDIHRRAVDIALRMVKPTQPDLVARKISTVDVKLYASNEYVSKYGVPLSPVELAQHSLILPRDDRQLNLGMERLGLDPQSLSVLAMSDDLRTRLAFMRAHLGISTCHDWIAIRDTTLHPILPDLVLAEFDLWLVATDDIHRSRSLRQVYDKIAKLTQKFLK